jgi:hypothetical protein
MNLAVVCKFRSYLFEMLCKYPAELLNHFMRTHTQRSFIGYWLDHQLVRAFM